MYVCWRQFIFTLIRMFVVLAPILVCYVILIFIYPYWTCWYVNVVTCHKTLHHTLPHPCINVYMHVYRKMYNIYTLYSKIMMSCRVMHNCPICTYLSLALFIYVLHIYHDTSYFCYSETICYIAFNTKYTRHSFEYNIYIHTSIIMQYSINIRIHIIIYTLYVYIHYYVIINECILISYVYLYITIYASMQLFS